MAHLVTDVKVEVCDREAVLHKLFVTVDPGFGQVCGMHCYGLGAFSALWYKLVPLVDVHDRLILHWSGYLGGVVGLFLVVVLHTIH